VTDGTLILAVLLIPLVGAGLMAFVGRRPNVRDGLMLVVASIEFLTVIELARRFATTGLDPVTWARVAPGLTIGFSAEPLGLLFALIASGLWIVTGAYGIGYMRGHQEKDQTRFFACFALAISFAVGIALSANLFTLFIFYEALTLSTYPLVTHHRDAKARAGGRVYLGVLMSTSIGLFLLGIVWTYSITGTLEFSPGGILAGNCDGRTAGILLALFAFGTGKAALMPFHRWLPAAMVAPTPVSALLHAVAVVKAGVFTVLKIAVYIFGIDFLRETGSSQWLTYVAGFTIIAASIVALSKNNLKARLAYSTISQLAYIVLAAALATPAAILGGGMHIAMHAFGKITLFFCAGAIYVTAHKTEISDMRGLGRQMPITMTAFLIGALSIIGLPPLGGSWSKWFLMLGAADADQWLFVGVFMVSSLLNIAYLMPIAIRGFFPGDGSSRPAVKEGPWFCVVPLSLTALGSLVLFFYADELYRWLLPLVSS